MNIGFSISLVAISFLFFATFLLFGLKNYHKRFSLSYDMRNTFPYEINYQMRFTDNVLVNSFLVLSLASSIGFFVFFDIKNILGVNMVVTIAGIISIISIFFIFFTDLKYIRLHLVIMVLLAIASFTTSASIAIISFQFYQNDHRDIFSLVMAIILSAVSLFLFAVMMNPRLNFKLNMQKAIGVDGKEILVRPKYFVLAFSEWLFIFSLFLNELLLLILYIPR